MAGFTRYWSGAALLAVLSSAGPVVAQQSLVPVHHPVYEFLHRQRVAGRTPWFRYEALPLSRGDVHALLDSVAGHADLSRAERALVASYGREFATPVDPAPVTLTQGRAASVPGTIAQKVRLLFSDDEPHFFQYARPDGNVTADYVFGKGTFIGGEGAAIGDGPDQFGFKGFVAYGTIYGSLGFHVEGMNPAGSPLLRFHPEWGKTYDVINGRSSALFGQAFFTLQHRAFRFDLGNGPLRLGAGEPEAVVFRETSAGFSWLRATFATRTVDLTYLHGALTAPVSTDPLPGFPDTLTRTAPSRWVVAHRVAVRPSSRVQLAITETVAYSNRGLDPTYLNPVYPLRLAEFSNGERDNPVVYLDATVRPVNGVELHGALGIDDLYALGDLYTRTGRRSNNDLTTKLLYQAGARVSLPGGVDARLDYTMVDPFFYTHRFALNTYSQQGFALGSSVGPNGDQLLAGIRVWLPWRAWLGGSLAWGRRGMNLVDTAGAVVQDVGGSLTSVHNGQRILFLAGDRHRTRVVTVEAALEPWRGVRAELVWERRAVLEGTQLADYGVLRATIGFTWYPLNFLLDPIGL